MKTSFHTFRQLRWKLTLSYALIIPLVILMMQIVLVILAFVIIELFFVPQLVLYGLQQYQAPLKLLFVHNDLPDQKALSIWIQAPGGYPSGYDPELRAIVDTQGRVVVSSGHKPLSSGTLLQSHLPAIAAQDLQQVLTGKIGGQGAVNKNPDSSIIAIMPIKGIDNRIVGALIDNTGADVYTQETHYWIVADGLYILISLVVYALFGFIISIIGGFFTAGKLTRRFNRLATVADNWSHGDFSTFARDPSNDELGQLTQKLNRMAEQLQNLLQTRQQVAILEERNRLARDLHDSVKQHIFVTALQVGTAKMRLGPGTEEIQHPLTEAEHALQQVQQELQTLIRELRPVALEGKGLPLALQDLVTQWSRQTSISATFKSIGKIQLPLLVEEAYFRIAQEALANVARHSGATAVQVELADEQEGVSLSLCDNGHGFDVSTLNGKGIGLHSMQERIKALGGEIHIKSSPEKGTCIVARCEKQHLEALRMNIVADQAEARAL